MGRKNKDKTTVDPSRTVTSSSDSQGSKLPAFAKGGAPSAPASPPAPAKGTTEAADTAPPKRTGFGQGITPNPTPKVVPLTSTPGTPVHRRPHHTPSAGSTPATGGSKTPEKTQTPNGILEDAEMIDAEDAKILGETLVGLNRREESLICNALLGQSGDDAIKRSVQLESIGLAIKFAHKAEEKDRIGQQMAATVNELATIIDALER